MLKSVKNDFFFPPLNILHNAANEQAKQHLGRAVISKMTFRHEFMKGIDQLGI